MDFKSLREQILANIDQYDPQDMKVVITKLLDFLIDINDKRTKLEIENKKQFEEVNQYKNNFSSTEHNVKLEEIFIKTKDEANKIIEKANSEKEQIISLANAEALNKGQEIMQTSIDKIESIISEIKKLDEETKLYRSHILSIFRKTIFRFADSNYYIIRSDNKDFQELLHFFEVDEKLQKLCDENIEKIENKVNYQKLIQEVDENPDIDDIGKITNILNETNILIDNEKVDVEKVIKNCEAMEEEVQLIEDDEVLDEIEEEKNINKQTFMEILNKYKKK